MAVRLRGPGGMPLAFAAGAATASLALMLWRRRGKRDPRGVAAASRDVGDARRAAGPVGTVAATLQGLVATAGAGAVGAGQPLAERLAAIADPRYHAHPDFRDGGPAALPRPVRCLLYTSPSPRD